MLLWMSHTEVVSKNRKKKEFKKDFQVHNTCSRDRLPDWLKDFIWVRLFSRPFYFSFGFFTFYFLVFFFFLSKFDGGLPSRMQMRNLELKRGIHLCPMRKAINPHVRGVKDKSYVDTTLLSACVRCVNLCTRDMCALKKSINP